MLFNPNPNPSDTLAELVSCLVAKVPDAKNSKQERENDTTNGFYVVMMLRRTESGRTVLRSTESSFLNPLEIGRCTELGLQSPALARPQCGASKMASL